jgi:AraC-like DNA-binding protein
MQFQVITPSPPLAPYIRHYWVLETNLCDGIVKERVVPTGNIELMFHYRKPFLSISPSGESKAQSVSMISGISHSWFDVSTMGESGALAVTFFPGSAAHFFNLPMMELEGKSQHLGDIAIRDAGLIEEQIAEVSSTVERVRIVENFLLKRLRPVSLHDIRLVQQGVHIIKKQKGQIRASELAQNLCVTPRTLERKFACYVGNTPKKFIKIVRFHEVMTSLTSVKTGKLTQHAIENGYFDQAHFIRDFKSYSGFTPKELISNNFCPDLGQDIGQA